MRNLSLSLLLMMASMTAFAQLPEIINFSQLKQRMADQKPDEVVVYNFWATWCKPCVEEMPGFEQLNSEYKSKGVRVVFVSMDFSSKQQKVADFIAGNKYKSEVVILSEPDANSWIDKINPQWSGAIPATLVVKGDQQKFHEGSFTYKELVNFIQPLI